MYEINRNPRSGFAAGMSAGEKSVLQVCLLLTSLSFIENDEYELLNFISYRRKLFVKEKYELNASVETGVITRTPNLNDDIEDNSNVTKLLVRIGGGVTYYLFSRFHIAQKTGVEYSAGRDILPFVNMSVNISLGKKKRCSGK